MEKTSVSKATLGRLPGYLQLLCDMASDEESYISATAIAKKLSLGEVQVRKDLAAVSGAGKPKIGYKISELIENLQNCLGGNQSTLAVLVGAGKLGRALLDYDGFKKFGLKIEAAFDSNEKVLSPESKIEIQPMAHFKDFCKSKNIQIGIITVGEGSAQAVCDQMVDSGITAIMNFAPCKLTVPSGVVLQNENLALSLAHLNSKISK